MLKANTSSSNIELLTSLPLFLGMTRADIAELTTAFTLGIHRCAEKEVVAEEGQPCTRLTIVADGAMRVCSRPDDGRYSVEEALQAPYIIQPEHLFGHSTRHTRIFTAHEGCLLLSIDKNDVMQMCARYQVFHINLLNAICAQAQRFAHTPWRHTPAATRPRIIRFILNHCLTHTGSKRINIRMEQLAHELNESRRAVSDELHLMHNEQLIVLKRETIMVEHLEKLLR